MYEKIPKLLQLIQNLPRAVPAPMPTLFIMSDQCSGVITLTSGPTRGHIQTFCISISFPCCLQY